MAQLAFGSHGSEVGRLQMAINAYIRQNNLHVRGIGSDNQIDVDNSFGGETKRALEAVQRHRHKSDSSFMVDGLYGRQSARLLTPLMGTEATSANTALNRNRTDGVAIRGRSGAQLRGSTDRRTGAADRSRPLSAFDNRRVNVELRASRNVLPYKKYRFGTARTVELIERAADLYRQATGYRLRVGDLSKRGGGDIPGHGSHEHGLNIDLDLAFNDGRLTAEPKRESINASYRSPAYDRAATRRLIQIIKQLNPRAQILFNDPVLVREGLVRAFPAHDNHLHIQGLGG